MYLVEKELTGNHTPWTASGLLVQARIKIDKIEVSGCDLDELSRLSVYFIKSILVPQTVTRAVVQETSLLPPALLYKSAKEIHEENILSISKARNTFDFSN